LTDQLLTPFSAHIINKDMFFKDVADLISLREKEIEDKRKEEKRVEEMSKPENVLKSFDSILITENDNKQWLLSQLPFKVITLKLLFRGSKHGWSPDKFHELCDDKGSTISIFKSKANRVFGGFTQMSWKANHGGYKTDERAFIFSMDRKQIYKVISNIHAIYCFPSDGPDFGG
jgi:hypothetical protein